MDETKCRCHKCHTLLDASDLKYEDDDVYYCSDCFDNLFIGK